MKVIGNLTKDAIIRAAVSEGLTFTQAVGTPVDVDTVATTSAKITFDSSNNKVVVVYTDQGNTYRGKAVVGTVDPSNNSISFGTPVTFYSGEVGNDFFDVTFDSNSNKVVIVYQNVDESNDGYAVVGTVSGTSISFGTPVEFSSDAINMVKCTFDSSNNKVVIVYKNNDNSNYGTAIVGTVSGTSISYGSAVVFNSNNTSYPSPTFDTSNNKVVITYRNQSTTHATAIVGTVSGTSISFGSATAWHTSSSTYQSITFDSTNNKVIVVANQSGGYAAVGTVSGTSISFGSVVNFASGSAEYNAAAFDSNTGKVVIVYKQSSTDDPALIVGEVSGTSISFGTAITLQGTDNTNGNRGITFDSNAKKIVTVYMDSSDNRNEAVVFQTAGSIATGGTIADGKAVIVNANGTVSTISSSSASLGSEAVFESASVTYTNATFDSNSNKVVVAYNDVDNSYSGTAVVGTVSGSSITFGTPVVFNSGESNWTSIAFDSNSNKVVIAYRDNGNSGYGTAIVGTVSGTSISFGTEAVFNSGNTTRMDMVFDSNSNKIVIAFADVPNGEDGTAIVGTVSGTSISFGSKQVFHSYQIEYPAVAFDSNSNKVVIAYSAYDGGDKMSAVVGTVSGTSISFGSTASILSGTYGIHNGATFDSNSNKVVITFRHQGSSSHGTAIVGTVSGTSISFGSAVVFNAATTNYPAPQFDSNTNKVVVSYLNSDTNVASIVVGTVSGTSISFGSATAFNTGTTNYIKNTFDSNSNKVVTVYRDNGNSNYGTAIVFAPDSTTLTSENFIGFSDGAFATTQSAVINTANTIDRNQTSLTPGQTYFVTPAGALSTTAGTPSVTAGTAISNTELIVKG